jgi:hypothetical protein
MAQHQVDLIRGQIALFAESGAPPAQAKQIEFQIGAALNIGAAVRAELLAALKAATESDGPAE